MKNNKGFSLTEVMVSLLVVVVVVGVVVPSMMTIISSKVSIDIRNLCMVTQELRNEAIIRGRVYRLVNVDNKGYEVQVSDEKGLYWGARLKKLEDDSFKKVKKYDLASSYEIKFSEGGEGVESVYFYPYVLSKDVEILLSSDSEQRKLVFKLNRVTGKLQEGTSNEQ